MNKLPLSRTEYGIFIEQVSKCDAAYNLPVSIRLGNELT